MDSREPCKSGNTDCTTDCGWCKGTGYMIRAGNKPLGLLLTLYGPKRPFLRRRTISVHKIPDMMSSPSRWVGHPITYPGVYRVTEEKRDGQVLVTERVGW